MRIRTHTYTIDNITSGYIIYAYTNGAVWRTLSMDNPRESRKHTNDLYNCQSHVCGLFQRSTHISTCEYTQHAPRMRVTYRECGLVSKA